MRSGLILAIFAVMLTYASTLYVGDDSAHRRNDGYKNGYYSDIQIAIDKAVDGDTIRIAPGVFHSKTYAFPESLCGNCEDHLAEVNATRGFLIKDKGLTIIGTGKDSTTLVTNAGYGVLFLDSERSTIMHLKITGGKRDLNEMATDAGIVARNSSVTITECAIEDNTDRPEDIVVGIGGIFGREGSELFILGNRIFNNGWDGIALYRGATAYIADNSINGGRGAGIGITWDATAQVYRNTIENYWKGIGAFGDSRAIVSNNIVQDNLGWGIIITGTAYMDATNNIVTNNGNCGLAIWSNDCEGRFANNIVFKNGWREQWVCPPVGLWNNGDYSNIIISHNDIFDNTGGEIKGLPEIFGSDGNISVDPLFSGDAGYILMPESPCVNSGDPKITDNDGSRSDMGTGGGPRAKK